MIKESRSSGKKEVATAEMICYLSRSVVVIPEGSHSFDGSTSIDINTTIDTVTNEEIDAMMDA